MSINTQGYRIELIYAIIHNNHSTTMSNRAYEFKETENKRWGIYLQGRLLATAGSYEVCRSIGESLNQDTSYSDTLKAAIAYKKAINRSLIIN